MAAILQQRKNFEIRDKLVKAQSLLIQDSHHVKFSDLSLLSIASAFGLYGCRKQNLA